MNNLYVNVIFKMSYFDNYLWVISLIESFGSTKNERTEYQDVATHKSE